MAIRASLRVLLYIVDLALLCRHCSFVAGNRLPLRASDHWNKIRPHAFDDGWQLSAQHGDAALNPLASMARGPLRYREFSPIEREWLRSQLPASIVTHHPILFIPPLMGTELQYRLHNKQKPSHWWCPRSCRTWSKLWVNPLDVLPGWFACFVDNIRLLFDPNKGLSHSEDGVEVRTVTPDPHSGLQLFGELTHTLQRLGWKDGVDMLQHAYDWRLTPRDWHQAGGSFDELKAQIEDAVAAHSGRPVIAFSISLGGSYFGSFLTSHVTEEWKAANIQGLVSISGVWGGTPRAAQELVQPWLYGVDRVLDRQQLMRLVRSIPSISWMLPSPQLFGNRPTYFNTATNKSYSAASMGEMLRDASAQQPADVWTLASNDTLLPAPNVTLYCVYSLGLPTVRGFTSTSADFSTDLVDLQYGDGDVTVPRESVALCEQYRTQQDMPVFAKNYEGFVHAMMLNDPQALLEIVQMVVELNTGKLIRISK